MPNPDGTQSPVRPRTAVLTAGFDPHLSFGSARPAVFRSSTYVFATPEAAERAFSIMAGRVQAEEGERADLIYSRFSHPNSEILEDQIVHLEPGAQAAGAFNSGMAAIMTAFVAVARPGTTIVYTTPLYGGTTGLIHSFLEPFGVQGIPVPGGDTAGISRAIQSARNLSIVCLETPANPTMVMTDIRHASEAARNHPDRPVVMVDNTFLGPTFQHPLMLGADLVLYSGTKYLSGFSDMVAGVALSKDPQLMRQILLKRGMFGNILQPDECWMLDGRLPTVALRMNRQSKNAQRLAEALRGHPKIKRVLYPTLFEDAEQRRIYEEQCAYPGGIFSLDFEGRPAAFDFLRNLKIGRNAVSLGGVETLVCHPKSTTHSGMSAKELDEAGIGDGLVRVSVGIEDWRDVLADFEQALERVQ
ncbi:MAG TPA: PLP-dependent transferase [Bryobacteraceae bacterium]|jgi:cystathionine beta-lyase/cystathionine gamma-synthase|nr:PLP-dependent transferase [Bryobacteraceae bacterium]